MRPPAKLVPLGVRYQPWDPLFRQAASPAQWASPQLRVRVVVPFVLLGCFQLHRDRRSAHRACRDAISLRLGQQAATVATQGSFPQRQEPSSQRRASFVSPVHTVQRKPPQPAWLALQVVSRRRWALPDALLVQPATTKRRSGPQAAARAPLLLSWPPQREAPRASASFVPKVFMRQRLDRRPVHRAQKAASPSSAQPVALAAMLDTTSQLRDALAAKHVGSVHS